MKDATRSRCYQNPPIVVEERNKNTGYVPIRSLFFGPWLMSPVPTIPDLVLKNTTDTVSQ
jgi:hypothetical protein